ncbi:MAG: LacI family DNA-binding transcriptional regulator [Edaphobacter sp.]|uniref:LacI family DNA-binding transcriptional regulator n=1 Tax=Edaphobacter sp. TaxID=1934404 RepID=UPI0023932F6D|nr:LacI family DNA-binding transcriptional regulator [Edaphobacter sp.]MDE1177905.1 LacI family DNA-binding transcriptional regulator [Edaphobacter sp.]
MSAPKLSDIAKRAGVSVAAVSIALNNKDTTRVSAVKRELIQKIAKELGYAPNELAKALAERRTRLLGLMVPMRDPIFFNQFIAQALSGIQATVMRRGYNLLIYSPSGRPGRATRDQILESRFTDGLIFINTRSCTTRDINDTIHELDAAKIHFTMINSYYGRAAINYVGVDDAALAESAVRYLVDRGHRRIAFLSGAATLPTHIHLLQGLRRGLTEAGLELKPEHIGCTEYDQVKAFTILDGWFSRRKDRPTAIFTADDSLLVHMYDYVEARQLSVPGDVAILARANSANAGGLRPRPSAFFIPTFEMGQLAADMLIDSIEKPAQPRRRILLPFTLSEGKTA